MTFLSVPRRRNPRRRVPRAYVVVLSLSLVAATLWSCGGSSTEPDPAKPCPGEPGTICTLVGNGDAGFNGDGKALLESALYWPEDMAQASDGTLYILDWNNHRVRIVTPQNTLKTVIGTVAFGDGVYWEYEGQYSEEGPPGAPGTVVSLNHPTQIVERPDGTMLLVAWHGHKLRTYDPSTGNVWIMCGAGAGFAGDGGPARQALLSQPQKVAINSTGQIYVLDQRNQRIRRIDTSGVINTVVGNGRKTTNGFPLGDGGPPLEATMAQPDGGNPPPGGSLCLDDQGRIYFTDPLNQRIRRVDFAANVIETVVGTGTGGFNGDGLAGTATQIDNPRDIEFGPDGRVYFSDEYNNRVRVFDPASGTVSTTAGSGAAGFGTGTFDGDGGPAAEAHLNRPSGIAFGLDGRLYIADTFNGRVRVVKL